VGEKTSLQAAAAGRVPGRQMQQTRLWRRAPQRLRLLATMLLMLLLLLLLLGALRDVQQAAASLSGIETILGEA